MGYQTNWLSQALPTGRPANRYLREIHMPAFNAKFACPVQEQGTAFVSWIGGNLDDVLCEKFDQTDGNDNCVRFEGLIMPVRFRAPYSGLARDKSPCYPVPQAM